MLKLSVKVLLQGAVRSAQGMGQELVQAGLVPFTQPYTAAPFSYAGTESVTAIPTDVVDWVILELRDKNTTTTVRARRAAFVKKDGMVVDLDGVSPVEFVGVQADYYAIVVIHRNHLAVRSACALYFALSTTVNYDFTVAAIQAASKVAQVTTAMGWAMQTGDVNGDGRIVYAANGSDVDQIKSRITNDAGNTTHVDSYVVTNVYDSCDVTMDGTVSAIDKDYVTSAVLNAVGNPTHSSSYFGLASVI